MSKPRWFATETEAREQARKWSLIVGRPIYVIHNPKERTNQEMAFAAHDDGHVNEFEVVVGLYQRGAPGLKAKQVEAGK